MLIPNKNLVSTQFCLINKTNKEKISTIVKKEVDPGPYLYIEANGIRKIRSNKIKSDGKKKNKRQFIHIAAREIYEEKRTLANNKMYINIKNPIFILV